MGTEIINDGASLRIIQNGLTRLVVKLQIKEILVISGNIVKIDKGSGLYNIFIPHADVTNPVTANAEALRDAINAMLNTGNTGGTGAATEAKQDNQIIEMQNMNTKMTSMLGKIDTLNDRVFIEALLIDEATPNTIYKGYAIPGSATNAAVWAIERVTISGDVTVTKWAAGNKNFDKVWDNRSSLTYL
jgi:hypothetical protein